MRENQPGRPMQLSDAIETLVSLRQSDQIVITNQGPAREWPRHCQHPLDFHYIPSAMGAAIPLAAGLALAQPKRHVLVLSGDGSLLMNLGCLVTVAAAGVDNLSIVVIDNGVYEVTGGQRTAGSLVPVDYAGLARAAGIVNVCHCVEANQWRQRAPELLAGGGPRLAWLEVEPVRENYLLDPPCPIQQQLDRLREQL